MGHTTSSMRSRSRSVSHLAPSRRSPRFGHEALDTFIDGIVNNAYSWTWEIDADLLARTAVDVRRWAQDRYGPLELLPHDEYESIWRAYDLPADR